MHYTGFVNFFEPEISLGSPRPLAGLAKEPEEKHRLESYLILGERKFFNPNHKVEKYFNN